MTSSTLVESAALEQLQQLRRIEGLIQIKTADLNDARDTLKAIRKELDTLLEQLRAVVRGEGARLPLFDAGAGDVDQTPGCDCDQAGRGDEDVHASDCSWRLAQR